MKRSDSSVWCLLAALLGARALDHALFATWVFRTRPGWEAIFETGATYGLIDGALGNADAEAEFPQQLFGYLI